MSNKKNVIKIYIRTLIFSFRISFSASPAIMIFRMMVILANSFVPIINIFSIKNIINCLIESNLNVIYFWFLILAITQIFTAIIGKINSYLSTIHADKISYSISHDIIAKINELDISYFDNPELYDEMVNVRRDINSIPSLIWNVFSSVQVFIQLFTASIVLFKFIWWSPILIIISCLPNFISDKKYSLKMYNWTRESVNEVRKMNYSFDTLTSKYFSKDIRINCLQDYLKKKYSTQWMDWYAAKRKLVDKQFIASFITMFIPHLVTIFFTFIVINNIIKNSNDVGDFSYYIGIMGQVTTCTFRLIGAISNIIQQKTKIEYYDKFKNWIPLVKQQTNGLVFKEFQTLEFKNVSFKYPHSSEYVLNNISFIIRKNEKIGLVGKNGCGKSTIIKLILRLYEPSHGSILLNGLEISQYDTVSYYRILSTMPQDYINYSFSLRENIKTADINSTINDEKIILACKQSEAYDFIKTWENGIDSYLTKSFDINGKELSTGQWQKLSLSRFFFKRAQFYIMDEPSASLDIESEYKIFENVFSKITDSTLLLVSHRLTNLRMMDKIIVIDNGTIVESGNHEELLQNNSVYAKLYNIQKQKF